MSDKPVDPSGLPPQGGPAPQQGSSVPPQGTYAVPPQGSAVPPQGAYGAPPQGYSPVPPQFQGRVPQPKKQSGGLIALKVLVTLGILGADLFASFYSLFIYLFTKHEQQYWLFVLLGLQLAALLLLVLIWRGFRVKWLRIACLALTAVFVVSLGTYAVWKTLDNRVGVIGEQSSDILIGYNPVKEGSKVALLDGEAFLRLDPAKGDALPRMDGATALYPIYAAFAKAVYPEKILQEDNYPDKVLSCTQTNGAYVAIVKGDADIIFAAEPSQEQKDDAAAAGVELVYTPIGREAFVFFVNARNPIEGITVKDIRGIYSGQITKWSELGVSGLGNIRAFQRRAGSGSQSALIRLMGDTPLMEPKEASEVIDAMGGIIDRVSDYKNYKNSIGYSFRFYSTEMVKNNQIRLLPVEGVEPTEANISNGTYPIASHFYAVTRSDASEETKRLLEWICGPEGQELIRRTGYTPLE
ncbi:MAG: substrate-binding domain-containing protein [Lachnospiraceae bacterium]|nr:substrate-binding domain-containing protein [Lachnospiraceae bacterium]